jgi:hypothetical protein
MKPTMLFAIILMTSIVLMTMFNITLSPTQPITLAQDVAQNALYVCPIKESTWVQIANGLSQFHKPLLIGLTFAIILLCFSWAWALYQNLLKDKFVRDAFKTPWSATKMLFWATMIMLLIINTPDHYRTVHVTGARGNWVLCENNTPGARAVNAQAVHR